MKDKKIIQFIKNNNLEFEEGTRNSTIIILIGYSQYLEMNQEELEEELEDIIIEDNFVKEEIERLWGYCKIKKYKDFWKTETAKDQYEF